MLEVKLIVVVALLSFLPPLRVAQAEPSADRANMFQACSVLHREDPSVSVVQCLGFLQASDTSPKTDWVPPFCRALAYYEPELFYSAYTSVPDCVVHNEDVTHAGTEG